MATNDRLVASLRSMNDVVKGDYNSGNKWTYTNSGKRKKTFEAARAYNRKTNCIDAVHFGCRDIGIPASALDWYGNGGIKWCSNSAKANAKKYFVIKNGGGKTVKALQNGGHLQPGDILTYTSMAHTNAWLGKNCSFDAGGSEGKIFKKWIFSSLKWPSAKVAKILRVKNTDAPATNGWWVQCGAFKTVAAANERVRILNKKGLATIVRNDPDYIRVQVGQYQVLANAQAKVASVKALTGLDCLIKEA